MKRLVLTTFTVFALFMGCSVEDPKQDPSIIENNPSESNKTATTPKIEEPEIELPKNDNNSSQTQKQVISAGGDQTLMVGTPLKLYATVLDSNKEIVSYEWKLNGKLIATSKSHTLSHLKVGTYSIELIAKDAQNNIFSDTITVTIQEPDYSNTPPVANDLNLTVDEDVVLYTSLDGSDGDGDSITYSLVTLPKHGRLKGSAVRLSYIPDSNYFGEDSFLYKVNDGKVDSPQALAYITINSINDKPKAYPQKVTLQEDSKNNQIVLKADDVDDTNLTYTIVSKPTHGTIKGVAPNITYTPDRDFNQTDFISFKVSDGKSFSDVVRVTIEVNNTTEAPTNIVLSNNSIDENSPTGTVIGKLSIVDVDSKSATFSLVDGEKSEDNSRFEIDEDKLLINFKSDYEKPIDLGDTPHNNNYAIRVKAVDSDNHVIEKSFIIKIRDKNGAPQFEETNTTIHIKENSTYITTLKATDPENDKLRFYLSIISTNDFSLYQSGELYLKKPINYEDANNEKDVSVIVSDGEFNTTKELHIIIDDINEKPTLNSQNFSISENSAIGSYVGDVVGSDPDGDSLTYSLSNNNNTFKIENNGSIYTKGKIDFESQNSYHFTVSTSDGTHIDSATVDIGVDDINEAPVVKDLNISIREDENSGTKIGHIEASDEDNNPKDTLTYTLNNYTDIFSTNSSGDIFLEDSSQIDHEGTQNLYDLNLTIDDGNGHSISSKIYVTITDATEAPKLNDQNFTIDENLAIGSYIGDVVGSDPDGDTLTYNLSSTNEIFKIENNGSIYTKEKLNFETQNSYQLMANASDGNSSDSATITITINDINEAPNSDNQTFSLDENKTNMTTVETFQAKDPENDILTFSIMGGNSDNIFDINSTSGKIYIKDSSKLDFETTHTYTLTIRIDDNNSNYTTKTATLNINNINEPPTIKNRNFKVDENATNATSIGTIEVSDPDSSNFIFSTNNNYGVFDIDRDSGEITVSNSSLLDYETNSSYIITIKVDDQNGSVVEDDITIKVNDIDEKPIIHTTSFDIAENSPIGTATREINATNPENYQTISYAINSTNLPFSIDTNSGELKVAGELNFEEKSSYIVLISVSDGNLTTQKDITINILDINEPPSIKYNSFSVSENSPTDTEVGTLNFSNPEEYDTLSFRLTGGNSDNAFKIDNSGKISVNSQVLNYEEKSYYHLTIELSDNTTTPVTQTIDVNISDVNEPPTAYDDNENIYEDTPSHIDVISNDYDPDHNSTLTIIELLNTPDSSKGIASIEDNKIKFTPANNFIGSVEFQYTMGDGEFNSTASVHLTITEIDDPPVAIATLKKSSDENFTDDNITVTLGDLVSFSASKSSDIDNNITGYEWWDGNILLSLYKEFNTSSLDIGIHNITLKVIDESGESSKDIRQVKVLDKNLTFTPHEIITNQDDDDQLVSWAEFGDLDNDGDLDIVYSYFWEDYKIHWLENNGDFNFTTHEFQPPHHNGMYSTALEDVDGDGWLDIAYTIRENNKIAAVCRNNHNKSFNCDLVIKENDDATFILFADLNQSGKKDIVLALGESDNYNGIFWYPKKDDGNFSTEGNKTIENSLNFVTKMVSNDIDKDGDIDLIASNIDFDDKSSGGVYIIRNELNQTSPNGEFTKIKLPKSSDDEDYCATYVSLGDINSDNYQDIIAVTYDCSSILSNDSILAAYNNLTHILIFENNQSGGFKLPYELYQNYRIANAHAVDLNHNGELEIVSSHKHQNSDKAIFWIENNTTHIIDQNNNTVYKTFIADLDNDGNSDIISFSEHGNMTIYENNYPTIVPKIPKPMVKTHGEYYSFTDGVDREYIQNRRNSLLWQKEPNYDDQNFTKAINYCKNLDLDGITEWRLPTVQELYFTINKGDSSTSNAYRKDLNGDFWSSTVKHSLFADQKRIGSSSTDDSRNVVCVKGDKKPQILIQNESTGTVFDNIHKLEWLDEDHSESNISDAINYCTTKGDGWRVANINELYSIYDENQERMYRAFKNSPNAIYFSSTKNFSLDFSTGITKDNDNASLVKCVRDIE